MKLNHRFHRQNLRGIIDRLIVIIKDPQNEQNVPHQSCIYELINYGNFTEKG